MIFIDIGQCTSSSSGSRDQFIEQIATPLSLTIVVLYSWLLGAIADGVSFSTIFHLIDIDEFVKRILSVIFDSRP